MALADLLRHAGLDEQVFGALGPGAFFRASAASRTLRQLPAPERRWRSLWHIRLREGQAPEAAALELLTAAEDRLPADRLEALLDSLYVLTLDRGCGADTLKCPVHTLLDMAVERRQPSAIRLLRKRGYTLELLDALSLESHVQRDDVAAVAMYLQAGISPDIRANAGRSVLMVAAASSSRRVLSLLLDWRADVEQSSGFGQWTALMWAAHVGWTEGCRLLLEAGASREVSNAQGNTALDIARRMGREEVCKLLEGAIGLAADR
eukprot:TRINITY_DN39215_c0_g1_i1.p1 TRINITY_DN39215_c0_g1~~TRINITY_DN39215_c0_g1_i1.p1  ORF type:complete len:283 (+),score=63.83 TRINITY_DN39215_c0_g1_i1:58-849(+)